MNNKILVAVLLMMVTIVCFGQLGQKVRKNRDGLTSENYARLKQKFKEHPEYDFNKDGILTDAEYRKGRDANKQNSRGGSDLNQFPTYCKFIPDLNYAGTENPKQNLDIYIPENRSSEKLPAIVYIHGGGFKGGSKDRGFRKFEPYIKTGDYVGFAVDYRLSDEAKWPAQIHDCKAAVRWVKANAEEYGVDPERIGAFGGSAGGHLVAMLALTSVSGKFEGTIGDFPDVNASIKCAVDGYGPADFLAMNDRIGSMDHDDPGSPESRLIGGAIQQNKEKARNASPVTWASKKCVPLMIYHGTEDDKVIIEQSEILYKTLKDKKVRDVYFIRVKGAGHSVSHPVITKRMLAFFQKYLHGEKVKIDDSDFDLFE